MIGMACRMKVEWSALPNNLIIKIVDCFLKTEDLDYYDAFQAACSQWLHATEKPEFYLSKWILVEHTLPEDGGVAFLNLRTSHFLQNYLSEVVTRFVFLVSNFHFCSPL
jgi:hypothetical protein